ncbi:RASEF protein, partial [Grus americana]|nr:RASEF protein [Grus americana]
EACHEDAVSLQGAAGPAGDGGGEPDVHRLRQDAAVRPSLAGQQWGAATGAAGDVLPPGGCCFCGYSPPLGQPLLPAGLSLLPPARTMNRSLCESNSSLRSALLLRLHADPGARWLQTPSLSTALWHSSWGDDSPHRPLPTAASWAGRDRGHSGAGRRQQQSSAPSMDAASLLSNTGSHSAEDGPPPSPGTEVRDLLGGSPGTHVPCARPSPSLLPQQHERREEPAPPCPMYRLVLAGDGGTGKSSFLLRLCTNEFRGDISSTLGVDFQIKQLLVDGEQTTLQIWDTAGQER